jgi:hypothetical protein
MTQPTLGNRGVRRPSISNPRARTRFISPWLIRRPDPVDWFRLLADLQGFGWSNADVARSLNVPPSTLARWKDGAEPGFECGRSLVILHAKVCTPATP